MATENICNFWLCFGIIILLINVVPYGVNTFFYFSSFLVLIRLSQWLMNFTRKFILNPQLSSHKKAVFITGCDSGVGHQLAIRLDQLGYKVFASCLLAKEEGAEALKTRCSSNVKVLELDVTKEESVQQALEFVKNNLEEHVLWAVVNNAGIAQSGEIEWTNVEEFCKVYDVNTTGVVRVTKAFLPLLRRSKGRIVNMSSRTAEQTCAGFVGYCMSKSAQAAFTKGLRIEMKKWDVKAIDIEPFFVKTPITDVETTLKLSERTWNKADEETKMAYGIAYLEEFKNSCRKTLALSKTQISEVIDCFVDAIQSGDPLDCYFPCYFPHQVWLKLSAALPASFSEMYQESQLPSKVKSDFVVEETGKQVRCKNGVSSTNEKRE